MAKANPLFSAGARLEREAFCDYLKRKLKGPDVQLAGVRESAVLGKVLKWVKGRQGRYDKRPGGLGK